MARTQEERRAETRAQLLSAAAELFAYKGFHATSAEAVAAAADRTTGALYDHFGGKNGLLVALLEQWMEQTVIAVTATLETQAELDARLAALWGGIISQDAESGDAWFLLEFELWLHAARDPQLGEVGAERFTRMRDGLAGGLEDWALEYGFDLPAAADELAGQIIALLLGSAFQHRLDPSAVSTESLVSSLRRLLGLETDQERSLDGGTDVRSGDHRVNPHQLHQSQEA